ncbi:MAG: hypothetical protein V3V00_06485 [Saprospiraceae bacterium]
MILCGFFIALTFFIIYSIGLPLTFFFETENFENSEPSFCDLYFLGFCVLSLCYSYVSIILPLNMVALLVSLLLTLLVIVHFYKKKLDHYLIYKRLTLYDLTVLSIVVFGVIFISGYGVRNYDTGLYHTQFIMWIKEYVVIPGLGNLHGRFAFNSLYFPINAMFSFDLNVSDMEKSTIYPLNATSFIVMFFWEYALFKKLFYEKNWSQVILVFFIVVLISTLLLKHIALIWLFDLILCINWIYLM